MLSLHEVGLRFGSLQVLQGLSLAMQAGERLALLGPSGCGKSSALRLLAGLLQPGSGRMLLPPALRRAVVFQRPTLMPWEPVRDNVALPLRLAGEALDAVDAAITRVGLAGFERALPHELSGGMQMRVALARAWVTAPELLLLDEPFGALDEITRQRLGAELLAWCDSQPGLALLLVTHSVFEAVALAERVLVMSPRPGRVVAELDLRAARTATAATAGAWTQSDAYFDAVRQAQAALAQAMEAAV